MGGIAQIIKNINRVVYACDIGYSVCIPKNCVLAHQGLGVVIHNEVKIGEHCTILQNVTIGANGGLGKSGNEAPFIGDNVFIGAGAAILENIKVGSNVYIGANAVVLHDVPDNVAVAGVPAVIKKYL